MTKNFSQNFKIATLALSGMILQSCSVKDYDEYEERPAEVLFKEAETLYKNKSYQTAAKAYAEVERQHPYSNLAVTAQLKAADSYYQAQKYDDAIENYKTFIQLHPGHEKVPYALYMIGSCHYDQIPIVQRDQTHAQEALEQFLELINRFEGNEYAKKAQAKIGNLKDHLAGKEMDVGRYYLNSGSYLAGINRFQGVVKDYPQTNHAPEAMYRIVECYLGLGLRDQAEKAALQLNRTHPSNPWNARAKSLIPTRIPSPHSTAKVMTPAEKSSKGNK